DFKRVGTDRMLWWLGRSWIFEISTALGLSVRSNDRDFKRVGPDPMLWSFRRSCGLKVRAPGLPPGPELDPNRARESPHHDVQEAAFAAKDLGLAAHVGLQQQGVILNFRGDDHRFGSQGIARRVGRSSLRLPGGVRHGTRTLRRDGNGLHLPVKR